MRPVLKTGDPQGSMGSNPILSVHSQRDESTEVRRHGAAAAPVRLRPALGGGSPGHSRRSFRAARRFFATPTWRSATIAGVAGGMANALKFAAASPAPSMPRYLSCGGR